MMHTLEFKSHVESESSLEEFNGSKGAPMPSIDILKSESISFSLRNLEQFHHNGAVFRRVHSPFLAVGETTSLGFVSFRLLSTSSFVPMSRLVVLVCSERNCSRKWETTGHKCYSGNLIVVLLQNFCSTGANRTDPYSNIKSSSHNRKQRNEKTNCSAPSSGR